MSQMQPEDCDIYYYTVIRDVAKKLFDEGLNYHQKNNYEKSTELFNCAERVTFYKHLSSFEIDDSYVYVLSAKGSIRDGEYQKASGILMNLVKDRLSQLEEKIQYLEKECP